MAKPRTNWDAVDYWAASILADEPAPALDVNSIVVSNDTVYSFGRHYPMGVIQRDERGRTVRVVLNSDFYPSRGFASTPTDQGNVQTLARHYLSESPRKIELKYQLLSAYKTNGKIRIRPSANDPEPPADSRMEVPRRYTTTDPGPEPVDDGVGCIAGERFGVTKFEKKLAWTNELREREDERPVELAELPSTRTQRTWSRERHVLAYIDAVLDGRDLFWVHTWVTYWTEYGTERWRHPAPVGAKYEQCPHCKAFQDRHDAWRRAMHGGYGVRGLGWVTYQECLDRFGGWDGWLEAWRIDRDRVRAERQAHAEWYARNHVPLDYIPTVNRVPRTDRDGYAYRTDAERYFRERRANARLERQARREAAERERKRRAFERFKNQINSKRPVPFRERAAEVVEALRALDPNNATVPPNDSQEVS